MSEPRHCYKILCVCRGGNVRSVAMKMLLTRYLDHDALACGFETTDAETRDMLYRWADVIVLLCADFEPLIRPRWANKLSVYDVGEDIWGNPFSPSLHVRLADMLNERNEFLLGRRLNAELIREKLQNYAAKIEARSRKETERIISVALSLP